MSTGVRFFGLLIITCMLVFTGSATAHAEKQITTPPPISGRQLSEPGSITAADVMARLLLTHQTLDQIRVHMGKPAPPQPLIEVSDVENVEVYFAALNLHRRGLRFGFERLRTRQAWDAKPSVAPNQADAFLVIDGILSVALHVKEALGIEAAIREHPQAETITGADVFNQILTTGALLNQLLEKRTGPDDNFGILTFSLIQALKLHSHFSRKLMPEEGALEKNKTPEDVLIELKTTFEELRKLGALVNVSMLTIRRTGRVRTATPDDVSEILVLVAAELGRILIATKINHTIDGAWVGASQFPSHNVRRVKMLRQILSETADAAKRLQ
ncbi:MAG: hypothetical protein JKY56_06485 [Kofleriaceae bacterium]|nr:hypothetical protein [Kofleriaceae bacterium]